MKVDGRPSGLIILDLAKLKKRDGNSEAKKIESSQADKVSTLTSQKLSDVVSSIESGSVALEPLHSGLSAEKAFELLDDKALTGAKPRPSDALLLKMADQVSAEILGSPEVASQLFSKLRSERTADIL